MAEGNTETKKFISPQTQRRLIADITSLYKDPLQEQGIYYIHNDSNMLEGHAMIIGPKETPYANGFYFFDFSFPYDYPFRPPKVKFLNQDGKTRYNPNLYRNGKVCLSIINTWKGEGWTSSQTIRSVLMTLVSIMNEEPILNEPGVHRSHRDFAKYHEIVAYKNIDFCFLEMLSQKSLPSHCIPFYTFVRDHAAKNKEDIIDYLEKQSVKHPEKQNIYTGIYNMKTKVDYPDLLGQVKECYRNIGL